jgi:hypothetical protein
LGRLLSLDGRRVGIASHLQMVAAKVARGISLRIRTIGDFDSKVK